MSKKEPGSGISRRDVLKRGAIVGGTLWVTPVVTTYQRAHAQGGSPLCTTYAVEFTNTGCLEMIGEDCGISPPPETTPGGCASPISIIRRPSFWQVTLPGDPGRCTFVSGASHSVQDGGCAAPIVSGDGHVVTFVRSGGKPIGRARLVFTCCP